MTFAVVALDLGTLCGWAVRHADGRIESNSQRFASARHEGDGARFIKFRAFLHDTKRRVEAAGQIIGEVRFETVDFIPEDSGARAPHIWGGFWGVLTGWCEHHGIPYRGVSPGTLKKAATGNGRASKDDVSAAVARKFGRTPRDDNEGDALALLLCEGKT